MLQNNLFARTDKTDIIYIIRKINIIILKPNKNRKYRIRIESFRTLNSTDHDVATESKSIPYQASLDNNGEIIHHIPGYETVVDFKDKK